MDVSVGALLKMAFTHQSGLAVRTDVGGSPVRNALYVHGPPVTTAALSTLFHSVALTVHLKEDIFWQASPYTDPESVKRWGEGGSSTKWVKYFNTKQFTLLTAQTSHTVLTALFLLILIFIFTVCSLSSSLLSSPSPGKNIKALLPAFL